MKKALIYQPAKLGDVINIIPIAQLLIKNGYEVCVPHSNYSEQLFNKNYFNEIQTFKVGHIDSELNHQRNYCQANNILFINTIHMEEKYKKHCTYFGGNLFIEQIKYFIANDIIPDVNINYENKFNLTWNRNLEREERLLKRLNLDLNSEYIITHLKGENGRTGTIPKTNIRTIEVCPLDDFTIFDWYEVIKNANVIYAIQSSIQCFVDAIQKHLDCEMYLINDTSNPDRLVVPALNWNMEHFINKRLV